MEAFFLVLDGFLGEGLGVSSVVVAGLAGGVDDEVEFASVLAFLVDELESAGA